MTTDRELADKLAFDPGAWQALDMFGRQQIIAALRRSQPEGEMKNARHKWDRDGERCLLCGTKDWMETPCIPLSAAEAEGRKP